MTAKVRVLVVEDNELFRLGTSTLIGTQTDLEVVGQAGDGAEALVLYKNLLPDVVMLDLRMPLIDGIQLTAMLRRETPAARVLVLTHYQGDEDITNALRAGALGYLRKNVSGRDLLEAIRVVAAGRRYVPADIAERLAESVTHTPLSGRELQVLHCIFEGLSNKEIAVKIAVAERSATTYVSRLMANLGAKSRSEAVAIGLRRGLLQTKE